MLPFIPMKHFKDHGENALISYYSNGVCRIDGHFIFVNNGYSHTVLTVASYSPMAKCVPVPFTPALDPNPIRIDSIDDGQKAPFSLIDEAGDFVAACNIGANPKATCLLVGVYCSTRFFFLTTTARAVGQTGYR